jgi:hypothetical protein
MQTRNLQDLRGNDSIDVSLPNSLWTIFDLLVRRQGLTADTALLRLIDALPGLSKADLCELQEPHKERVNRTLTVRIGRERKTFVEQVASEFGFSSSSILRRILYAFFVSGEIALFCATNDSRGELKRTQLHFDFADKYEHEKSTSLLSRQHRENS